MDIKTKIKYYMKEKDFSVYKLSQKSGLSQPTITNWFNKRNYTPSLDAIEKVCIALDITMAQLFCEDNENMIPVSEEERNLLEVWQLLNNEQRNNLLGLINSILTKQE